MLNAGGYVWPLILSGIERPTSVDQASCSPVNNDRGGNHFHGILLELLAVPVPRNCLEGIEQIKFEYELGDPSYLRGVKWRGGWWYYYQYTMRVKMPVGTLVLTGVGAVQFVLNHRRNGVHQGSTEGMNEASGTTSRSDAPCNSTLYCKRLRLCFPEKIWRRRFAEVVHVYKLRRPWGLAAVTGKSQSSRHAPP